MKFKGGNSTGELIKEMVKVKRTLHVASSACDDFSWNNTEFIVKPYFQAISQSHATLGEAKEQKQQTNDPTSILLDSHVHEQREVDQGNTSNGIENVKTQQLSKHWKRSAVAVSFKEILLISDFWRRREKSTKGLVNRNRMKFKGENSTDWVDQRDGQSQTNTARGQSFCMRWFQLK